jgi:hypothetical protein
MPTGKNWTIFMLTNILFIAYVSAIFYLSSIKDIKDNWPIYRCNPMYMPLSDNLQKDFTYCIQNIQTGMMGNLLQPITFITSSLSSVMGSAMDEINSVRGMFNKIRNFLSNVVQSIFGIFLNLVIEFIRIIISIRDLFGKTIGLMVSMMYVMDGSIKTMNSMWKGPPGQLVQALGKCFHPDTKVRLLNGEIKKMQYVDLGDVLENGSTVECVMKIDNAKNSEMLYRIVGGGIDGEDVLVTGSHSILDVTAHEPDIFIRIRDYAKAVKTDIQLPWFSCLITSDHRIGIADEIYWDWEDQLLSNF